MKSLQSSISSPSRFDSLSPWTISALSDLMGRRWEGFFGRAREKGPKQNKTGIDSAQVHKGLEDETKRRYNDAYDLETLKDYVQEIAYGMDGIEGKDDPLSLESVK
jgi:hypothetical protein